MSMVAGKVPKTDAEATVNELFTNQTEDKIQARKSAWESDRFGADGTPQEYVTEQMEERLKDPDDPIGQIFVADLGKWYVPFDSKEYGNIKFSAQMQHELGRNSYNMWLATESLEVAINAPLNAIRARGAAATDINFDVSVSSQQLRDEEGNGFEIQINPITKSGNKGEILPRDKVRAVVGKDISGVKFKAQFTPGDGRVYSASEIEIGDGEISAYGENKGNMQWPLKYMGGKLTHASGAKKDQPVYFYWGDTKTLEETPPIEKTAAKLVNKEEKKVRKLDRLDFSDTGAAGF